MNELATTNDLKAFNAVITSEKTQSYLQSVLGERKQSFVNNLTALVANDTKLQDCKPTTLMYAAMKATALDMPLDANLGYAYVIPYQSKEGKTAQLQIGYKGFIQLALRSGQFKLLNSTDVRDGEIVSRNRLTGEINFSFIENEFERSAKKIVGFVSYFELISGFCSTLYMSVDELKAHGLRYSKTFSSKNKYVADSSKWATDFEAMARKTVTKLNLSRNAPLSVELRNAVMFDQAVLHEEDKPTYVDNDKSVTDVKPILELETEEFKEAVRSLLNGYSIENLRTKYEISDDVEAELINQAV